MTCKPTTHTALYKFMYGVEDDELGPTERIGKKMRRVRYRWMNELPIPDGKDTMNVNWLEIIVEPVSGKKLYRNSFATDIPVDRSNVAELAECARARWKVENNTFKALMDGYHPEHNFEHGKATLASLLAMLNIHWRAKRHLPHRTCRIGEKYTMGPSGIEGLIT